MKKTLLALAYLGFNILSFGQDTYIKDAVTIKVNPNTLFYNGGSVTVSSNDNSATQEKIINEGNIKIVGNFTNSNTTGKNFVNKFSAENNFGQLIIKSTSSINGLVTMERSKPNLTNVDEYIISLPFRDSKASDVINSFSSSAFRGDCLVNTDCGSNNRYRQSLFIWDNLETEYDAVSSNDLIIPAARYLLNTRSNSTLLSPINSATNRIFFAGKPNNQEYNQSVYSGLKNGNTDYKDLTFGEWKNRLNNYNESYNSYLSNQSNANDGNKLFGKNLHRFGNPYTSNLDLSNVKTGESWITFNIATGNSGVSGSNLSPTQVYQNSIRFNVKKVTPDFKISWNESTGSSNLTGNNVIFSAQLNYNSANSNYFWTGSPEALLVKPYESFYIDYYTLNSGTNGNGTRIVTSNINLRDSNKTFDQNFASRANLSTDQIPGVFSRSSESNNSLFNNQELQNRGLVTDFDFTQLELYLSSNNTIQGGAAYLLNASFMNSGNVSTPTTVSNPVFFYEEMEDGTVRTNVQTIANNFNSIDYIGKPLRVGFNNLVIGQTYKLNLNLYEYSILNKVNNLSLGKYYLLDKQTNNVINVDENTELSFVYDANSNNRFEFYWNNLPEGALGTDELLNSKATYIYSNGKQKYIHFEESNSIAKVEVFDLTGKSLLNTTVKTNEDYKLNLVNIPSVYVVNITYENGKVVTKKTINK